MDITLTDVPIIFGPLFTFTFYVLGPTIDSKYNAYMYKTSHFYCGNNHWEAQSTLGTQVRKV